MHTKLSSCMLLSCGEPSLSKGLQGMGLSSAREVVWPNGYKQGLEFESCSFICFLSKSLNLPVLQFPHIKMEVMIVSASGLFWINEMIHVKCLEEYLSYNRAINVNYYGEEINLWYFKWLIVTSLIHLANVNRYNYKYLHAKHDVRNCGITDND